MPLDVDRLAEAVLAGTQALISKATAPLRAENDGLRSLLESLEYRVIELDGRMIPAFVTDRAISQDDIDGLKAAWDDRHGELAAKVELAISAAEDARSAAVEPVEPPALPDVPALVAEAVKAAVDALPVPQDGKDAELPDMSAFATKSEVDAEFERIASDIGRATAFVANDAATKQEVGLAIAGIAALTAQIEALPEPKDFGPEIADMSERINAIVVPEAIPGKDGRGIADVKVNDDREVIVKFTDGETKNLGKFDGRDGFGFDDMSTDWDGERTLTLSFTKDGRTELTSLTIPAIIDRGVWKAGTYERGDAVSWGGSLFIAQRDTEDKPETSDAWRLSAKRGRDGKDFRPPEDKAPVKAPSK